ncbi:chemotaxis protein CheW [Catenovulum sediminis]|uniref:chemotaxis protein CheW n=1 Tax=Catenovulum sediminis TaxID=1740262 RepID=UPI00117DE195|nr:chemotaxis protein CheW [Catenovulum sediminis]
MSNVNHAEAHSALLEDDQENRRQFVTFHVGAECMAFDMERVMEIVRVPKTVEVPLTPSSLLGLANLRGAILPVLSLRRVLQLDDAEQTDASRVMVLNYGGQPMGFVVDRVTRVIGVQPDAIENMEKVGSTIDASLLSGVLKNVEGQELVQLVDVDALTQQEYGHLKSISQVGLQNTSVAANNQILSSQNADDDEQNILQLVSFSVAGQEYSFSIDATQEIIRLPSKINSVPKAPPHVLGMIDLRNRVLPLVKLRTMFNLPENELSEMNRIVVLTLRRGRQVSMVGVVVDEVKEVLRIQQEQIEAVPALLLDSCDKQELEGICQLDEGKRIVTLLSAERLFHRDDVIEAVEAAQQSEQAHVGSIPESQREEEDNMNLDAQAEQLEEEETQLVVFNLENQEYGVMIESVKEILRLPENLTKVPKTLDFVEGMMNLRGNVLPIIDMRRRFNLTTQDGSDRQRILVLNHYHTQTGYIVDSVSEVLRLQPEQIEAAPSLSEDQAKIMGRIVNLRRDKRIITVLDPEQLLSANEQSEIVKQNDENINC